MPTGASDDHPERVAFVTGRLAEFALRSVVERLAQERGFEPTVIVLDVSVAALLTPALVARRLVLPSGVDRVVLPGYCEGNLDEVESAVGTRVDLGPKDLRDLPSWFSGETADASSPRPGPDTAPAIEILAEINHAPRLSLDDLLRLATHYHQSGADLIDIGCDPGMPWSGLGETVARLVDLGFRVAIDSFDPGEIAAGAAAGAELILSVHGANLEVARDLDCEVVLIPDEPHDLASLECNMQRLESWDVRFRLDPVLEPIGFGFSASLRRYVDLRQRFPDHAMMMGIGNLTELTDVDSAGVNALLIGFCEELDIGSVLTTEVIPWARSSVREVDVARRLMHHAVTHRVLPKHVDDRLIMLRDPGVHEHGGQVLEELARRIRDPSYRIFAERGEIHVMNRDVYLRGPDAFDLFESLEMRDASHAFYLGYEMAKATIALDLGKQYHQDRALRWGLLTREEDSHLERKRAGRRSSAIRVRDRRGSEGK